MDCRQTLHKSEDFLELLSEAFRNGRKVHLLIDSDGISRMEGFVSSMDVHASSPFIVLDQDFRLPLSRIIAVNGIFLPDYGEC